MTAMQTVVELPEFRRLAKTIMSESEREAMIDWIAANPGAELPLVADCERFVSLVTVGARVVGSERSMCSAVAICRYSS